MTGRRRTGFGLVVAATLALCMFAPGGSGSKVKGVSSFGIQDACAQTGTCKASPGDICFVNGIGFYEREWIDGGVRQE